MVVSRRPETPADEQFLRQLIIDSVKRELGAGAWPQPIRDHLFAMEYSARRQSVRTIFPVGTSEIILLNGNPAGWVYVADLPQEMRIVEILVSAEYRGKGVGSSVIGEIMARAGAAGKAVCLSVNP